MVNQTRIAVVTGATSGLGEAAALALAGAGWQVFVVGRDPARAAATVAKARAAGGTAEFVGADLFALADVRRLAGELRRRAPRIDLLINNAGGNFMKREITGDGLERSFALNVAAPFVLTEGLLPSLAAAGGRVVNVVTGVPKGARATIEQLAGPDAGAGMGAYIRAKLALQTLTIEQQRRHGARGVSFVSLHPGIIPGTRFGAEMPGFVRAIGEFIARLFRLSSTLAQAAERFVRVGTQAVEGGGFYKEGTLAAPPTQAQDPAFAAALWQRLAALTPGEEPRLMASA